MAQNVKVDFKWLRPVNRIIADKVLHDNKTLLFMADSWHRLYDKFTPMDTGLLAHDSVDTYVEGGHGIIHHKAPYAEKIYHGTHMKFRKEKHPLASAQWDEAAKEAGQKDILIKDTQAFINRGGRA